MKIEETEAPPRPAAARKVPEPGGDFEPVTLRTVVRSWWPLAASWLLMGLELPVVSATIARLPDPRIHLAAYGGVVFPLAMIIEAPIIMLLTASTALSRDRPAYLFVRRFMMRSGLLLTAVHALIAFTPLGHVVVRGLLGVPAEIEEPVYLGLRIMTPWTWAIAYRRFQQGVLIRYGRSRVVGTGTLIRLLANVVVLSIGFVVGTFPGIVVGATAVIAGVVSEALFIGIMVRPVIRRELGPPAPGEAPLSWRMFLHFYIPLAMTSLLFLLAMPIGTAAMTRMPVTLDSLAVWPVLSGLVFTVRSAGFALNEVVVALLDRPGALRALRSFTVRLVLGLTLILTLVAVTPLGHFWLSQLSALPDHLTRMGMIGLLLAIPLPAFSVMQSLYQGGLVHARRTRAVTESVVAYLVVNALVLGAGVVWGQVAGLYVSVVSMGIGSAAMIAWLALRSRQADRDARPHLAA